MSRSQYFVCILLLTAVASSHQAVLQTPQKWSLGLQDRVADDRLPSFRSFEHEPPNGGAVNDDIIQLLNISTQRSFGEKVDHVKASKLINAITSTSEDDVAKLHRSRRGIAMVVKQGYRWLKPGLEKAKRWLVERLNTQEIKELLIKEGPPVLHDYVHQPENDEDWVEKLLDIIEAFDPFREVGEVVHHILHEQGEEQFTEKQQIPPATDGQPNTTAQYAKTHQVTEASQITEGLPVTAETQEDSEDDSDNYYDVYYEGRCVSCYLHHAAEQGNLTALKYFVERGADVNAKNYYHETPLKLAVKNGHLPAVRYLVEKGANMLELHFFWLHGFGNDKSTVLHCAAYQGNLDLVNFLCENGADVNAKGSYNTTPLHYAAENGSLTVVEELIKRNADINAQNYWGFTPLHHAARSGRLAVVEELIRRNANIEAKDREGDTPLYVAVVMNQVPVIKKLKEKGAHVDRSKPIPEILWR